MLAIAFCWAWYVGAWRHEVKPIALKTHQRPAKSLFRYGFDSIRQAVLNAADEGKLLERSLSLLQKVFISPKRFFSYANLCNFVVYSGQFYNSMAHLCLIPC